MIDESADASALVESIPSQVLLQVSNEIAVRGKCNAGIFGNIYEVQQEESSQNLCMFPTLSPPGSSAKDKNSSKRTLLCYKKNHHNQELTWWESTKLLESMHLAGLNVTCCGKGQPIHLSVKEAYKVLYVLGMTKFKCLKYL